jgi:transposase
MNSTINQNEINVGVDTGKEQLDMYIRPLDIYFTVSNDEKGIKKALKEIKKHDVTRIIIEATGRLEYEFSLACKVNLPIVIVNPAHIRKFAGALGQLAKTDKLDAQLIAHYGEAMKPPLSALKPELMEDMSDLLARRRQLLRMQTMEKNRTKTMHKSIASSIKPILTALKNQLAKIDAKLEKLFDDCDEYKGKRRIRGGRYQVRTVMFMAMM